MNEALKKSIEESGSRLHLKVAQLLVREGWTVQISPYYVDDLTATPREIDIIASVRIPVTDTFGAEKDYFWIHLVVECKRFMKEVAFYEFKNEQPFDAVNAIHTGSLNRSEIIDSMLCTKSSLRASWVCRTPLRVRTWRCSLWHR